MKAPYPHATKVPGSSCHIVQMRAEGPQAHLCFGAGRWYVLGQPARTWSSVDEAVEVLEVEYRENRSLAYRAAGRPQ